MNREVYRHLASTYGRSPGVWFAFTAEVIRNLVARVVTVILLAQMVAAVSVGDLQAAQRYIFIWLVLSIFAAIVSAAGELVGQHSENRVYGCQVMKYYKKITNKDMAFYRDSHAGYLSAMLRQFADSGLLLARMLRSDFVRVFILLVAPAVVLLFASVKVGLLVVVIVVFQIVYIIWASSKANKYRSIAHEIYRKISGEVADDVTNIVAYKTAAKEAVASQRIRDLRRQEMTAFWLRRKTGILLDFPRDIITLSCVAVAFWFVLEGLSGSSMGANKSREGVALLVLTITYIFQILRTVGDLPDIMSRYDDLVTKLVPTLEVLTDSHETIRDKPDAKPGNITKGEIVIRNLTFGYGGVLSQDSGSGQRVQKARKIQHANSTIFKDFSLKVTSGEKLGIVGLSGAGKSTLASLLLRFDDAQSGSIAIDGVDIRDMTQSYLRSKIGYVPQEHLLFHRSIRENIAYHATDSVGKSEAALDLQVEQAARAAHAHEFITELPDGYDTMVGERGVKLSGGQKQRVVIARAVLKKAPIILFDEATSALDSESEHIIQKALPEIIGNHTAIIIAHRLSTVAGLDRIIVMHKGTIVEEGNHTELLSQKGRYYSLWVRQTNETSD